MPESFRFPEEMGHDITKGIWLPIQPTGEMLTDRGYHFFSIVGRLRPGISLQQARADLDQVAGYIRRVDPKEGTDVHFIVGSYQEMLTSSPFVPHSVPDASASFARCSPKEPSSASSAADLGLHWSN
jgi:hypothetical protein